MVAVCACLAFAANCDADAGARTQDARVKIEKKGTFDIFVVEANPVVFKGRLLLMEYKRQ